MGRPCPDVSKNACHLYVSLLIAKYFWSKITQFYFNEYLIFVLFRYQVAIDIGRKDLTILIDRGFPSVATLNGNLLPGKTYQVFVKTKSGSVFSWPATGNVTTRPLPVQNLRKNVDEETTETSFK